MIEFSPLTRSNLVSWTSSTELLIIGGGITGAGIALDAASRGIPTLLVEKSDFVSGTSSKSTKLVHGGLRYLRQMELGLVREAATERATLMKLAPHLVEEIPFLIPVSGKLKRATFGAGLWFYELLGGFKSHRHESVSPRRALELVPSLKPELHDGGLIYFDARADDCRLTLHVLKKAIELGAQALNYVEVLDFLKERECIVGCRLRDRISGREFEVRAKKIVAAVGVWTDELLARIDPSHKSMLRPSKGIHLVVPRKLIGNTVAVVVPSPKDKRIVFAIPWGEYDVIGTTDTDYSGALDHPRADADDIRYLFALVEEVFGVRLTQNDLISTYAGLRPLLAAPNARHPSSMSRDYTIVDTPSGVTLITGGKLTTYRTMAAKVVDRILKELGRPKSKTRTSQIPLFACTDPAPDHLPRDVFAHLVRNYGSEYPHVLSFRKPNLLDESLQHIAAEIDYAVLHESACTVADVLSRRTRAVLFSADQGRRAARVVAQRMGEMLRWSREEEHRQLDAYEAEIDLHRSRL